MLNSKLLVAACAALMVTSAIADCSWQMSLQWEAEVAGESSWPPLAVGKSVVTAHPDSVGAYDMDSGEILWQIQGQFVGGCSLLTRSRVVCHTASALIALDSLSGVEYSRFTLPSGELSPLMAPTVGSSTVFVGATDGKVYAIRASDFTLVWSADLGAGNSLVAPVSTWGPNVVVGSTSGSVFVLQKSDGSLLRSYTVPGVTGTNGIYTAIAVHGTTGYFSVNTASSNFVALDLNTMTISWRATPSQGFFAYTSPAINDETGSVYTTTSDGWILSLNPQDGSVEWRHNTHQSMGVRGPVALVADDLLVLSTESGAIIGFDITDRAVRFSLRMQGGTVSASPGVTKDGDAVAVSTSHGVYKMDLRCITRHVNQG